MNKPKRIKSTTTDKQGSLFGFIADPTDPADSGDTGDPKKPSAATPTSPVATAPAVATTPAAHVAQAARPAHPGIPVASVAGHPAQDEPFRMSRSPGPSRSPAGSVVAPQIIPTVQVSPVEPVVVRAQPAQQVRQVQPARTTASPSAPTAAPARPIRPGTPSPSGSFVLWSVSDFDAPYLAAERAICKACYEAFGERGLSVEFTEDEWAILRSLQDKFLTQRSRGEMILYRATVKEWEEKAVEFAGRAKEREKNLELAAATSTEMQGI